ncbi:hypothetical protein KCP75_12080 [Salmonella enterica subsp. enterica]|nr:hypothetical protein KCP75_12080 [Salmonella enterica subsp. enterica]
MAPICRKDRETGATLMSKQYMSTSTEVIAHHWAFAIFHRCYWPVLPDAGRRLVLAVAHARGTRTFRLNQVS